MDQPQQLLFMVHGLDQPFNTKQDRSEIARHLSRRYHRQKRLPLHQQSVRPETKVVHYPVTFHHGGLRLDVPSSRRSRRKKVTANKVKGGKGRVKKEEDVEKASIVVDPGIAGDHLTAKAVLLGLPPKYAASDQVSPIEPDDIKLLSAESSESLCIDLSVQSYLSMPCLDLVSPKHSWRRDPFNSLPILSDGCEPMMVDYFWQTWAPDADLEYIGTEYDKPFRSVVLPVAMGRPALLQSLVAMCRVFWLRAQGISWQNDAEYLKLRRRAVTALQERLESPHRADSDMLLAIACLNSIELMASNYSNVISHTRGLHALLDIPGEKDKSVFGRYATAQAQAHVTLGMFIKKRVNSKSGKSSLAPSQAEQRPPPSTQPNTTYPAPPYSPQLCNLLAAVPSGFAELAISDALTCECLNVIHSIHRKSEQWTTMCIRADVDSERSACYRLAETEGRTDTEYGLLYGIISFCNQFPDKFENRSPFFNVALKCFEDAFQAQNKMTWSLDQPALLWAAMATIGALEICARPIKSRFVILDTVLDQCSNAHSWEWLENELRKFLWIDGMGAHWRKCWEYGVLQWQEKRWNSPAEAALLSTSPASTTTRSASLDSATDACSPQSSATQLSRVSSAESNELNALFRDSCSLYEANRLSVAVRGAKTNT